jgi:hypothetical protein
MPLRLNVGLSRKVGEPNYGSRGASINLELELDGALASKPHKLQERIRQLFGLVRASLAEELQGGRNGHDATPNGTGGREDSGRGKHANSEGPQRDTDQRGNVPKAATQAQVKALFAIAKSRHLDLNQLLRERFRVAKPEDLTIQEASQLIDQLKNAEDRGGSG